MFPTPFIIAMSPIEGSKMCRDWFTSRAWEELVASYRWTSWVWEITGWWFKTWGELPIILEESIEYTRPMAVTRVIEFMKRVNAIYLFILEESRAWCRGNGVQSSSWSPEVEGDGCLQTIIQHEFLLREIVPPHRAAYTPHASCLCPSALTNRTLGIKTDVSKNYYRSEGK